MPNLSDSGGSREGLFVRKGPRGLWWGLVALILIWIAVLGWNWPFTHKAVVAALKQESGRAVNMGAFHSTLFPPGYSAENLVLSKRSAARGSPSTISVKRMVIIARWGDILLLRKRIKLASLNGLQMQIPAGHPEVQTQTPRSGQTHQPRFAEIGEVKVNDATFTFPVTPEDSDPFTITLQSLVLNQVNQKTASSFHARVLVNEPRSVIRSDGQLGPWKWSNAGQTLLSGSFVVEQADLSVLGGIAGILTGDGTFRGPLHQVTCSGSLDTPQFRVHDNPHSAPLSVKFRAIVNGLNGDTTIDQSQSQLNNTELESQGTIKADDKHPGKAVSLRISVNEGRVEDFLSLFTQHAKPVMTGIISMRANVEIPAGPPGFLKKVNLSGDFELTDARFTNPQTQTEINHLSKSSKGMSKSEGRAESVVVLSEIRGHVVTQQGTAVLTHSVVSVPGAQANIAGTCNLMDTTLNLHGILRTTGKLADATSGLKSALLKLLTPLWKKKEMTIVPFTICGKAQNPKFAIVLSKR